MGSNNDKISDEELSNEQIVELGLQGVSKYKEMKTINFDKFYHCYYYYFESGVDSRSMIKKEEGWYYPDLQKHIRELKEKWDNAGIPLGIAVENRRIKIFHETPSVMGPLAQLKLSPYLAYMFGYTTDVSKDGQYLRFDQEKEFLAPGEPKLFLDYCDNIDRENLQLEYEQKIESVKTDLESKWQFYAETKIAEMKKTLELEYETKLNKTKLELEKRQEKEFAKMVFEKELELKDCRDREEKDITPIKDFDLFHDQLWIIKGAVLGGEITTWEERDLIGKMYTMNIKDNTGEISITAFGGHAEVLSGLVVDGMEYYISNTNDENDMTASINNNAYKIHFEAVQKFN
jgi:hypothetical protein